MNFRFTPASAQASGRPVPRPRGPPPCGVDGKKCKWREGCWWQSDGSRYKPRTGATYVREHRQRKKDEQEQQARSAALQAAWRLRHYRPVMHHRLRSFHVMRGSWLRSKLMMATQTFLALWGRVAPSGRKRPYGKRLLAITALSPHYLLPITSPSPHYRLTIAGWQSGTSSVRPTRSTINTSSCQRQSGVCLRCRVSHHQRSRRVDLMRRARRQEHALATWRVTTSQTSLMLWWGRLWALPRGARPGASPSTLVRARRS